MEQILKIQSSDRQFVFKINFEKGKIKVTYHTYTLRGYNTINDCFERSYKLKMQLILVYFELEAYSNVTC